MSERTTLTVEEFTELQRAAQEREQTIIRGVLQVPDYPPLPGCPTCGEHPERTDSMVDEEEFGEIGPPLLINFRPCGHRFRAYPVI